MNVYSFPIAFFPARDLSVESTVPLNFIKTTKYINHARKIAKMTSGKMVVGEFFYQRLK